MNSLKIVVLRAKVQFLLFEREGVQFKGRGSKDVFQNFLDCREFQREAECFSLHVPHTALSITTNPEEDHLLLNVASQQVEIDNTNFPDHSSVAKDLQVFICRA